jgi:hypothetical protein
VVPRAMKPLNNKPCIENLLVYEQTRVRMSRWLWCDHQLQHPSMYQTICFSLVNIVKIAFDIGNYTF